MVVGFYDDPEWRVLPHPGIGLPVLLVVEHALCAAWDLLRTDPRAGFSLLTAEEDAVTLELHEALFDRVFNKGIVDGFDSGLFTTVEREPKVRSYDYRHPDKMPDLLVRLVGRPPGVRNTQDGLFIECKPVDSKHAVRGHYCDKGLIRFVQGDYAWAMPNAMMVGYAKEGYTVSAKLIPTLQGWPPGGPNSVPRACPHSKGSSISEVVHLTKHARRFQYLETKQPAPDIFTRHFYDELRDFEKENTGLQDAFPDWLHHIDVDREKKRASAIEFASQAAPEVMRAAKPASQPKVALAERELVSGNPAGAQKLAEEALQEKEDPARAYFVLARAATMSGNMQGAQENFQKALNATRDPRMAAWCHIYLGRILDLQDERENAVAQYQAALSAGDASADTKKAAERGLKEPYQPPNVKREQ